MNKTVDTEFGREVITLLTEALSALLKGVNKLSEGNARWIDLNSLEYLIEDARCQALTALKSGEAYWAIPILDPGDHFTLRTDETDLDEEGQERITPAGMVWVVQEREPECDPLMQYAVHCPQTGGSIHLTHAELVECGYSAGGNQEMQQPSALHDNKEKHMTHITELAPEMIDPILKEINEALEEIGKRHGLSLQRIPDTQVAYSTNRFTLHVDGTIKGQQVKNTYAGYVPEDRALNDHSLSPDMM